MQGNFCAKKTKKPDSYYMQAGKEVFTGKSEKGKLRRTLLFTPRTIKEANLRYGISKR